MLTKKLRYHLNRLVKKFRTVRKRPQQTKFDTAQIISKIKNTVFHSLGLSKQKQPLAIIAMGPLQVHLNLNVEKRLMVLYFWKCAKKRMRRIVSLSNKNLSKTHVFASLIILRHYNRRPQSRSMQPRVTFIPRQILEAAWMVWNLYQPSEAQTNSRLNLSPIIR